MKPQHLQQKEIASKEHPKAKLKALKEEGIIVLDDNTELHGIPSTDGGGCGGDGGRMK